jgi:hypothetical protein
MVRRFGRRVKKDGVCKEEQKETERVIMKLNKTVLLLISYKHGSFLTILLSH